MTADLRTDEHNRLYELGVDHRAQATDDNVETRGNDQCYGRDPNVPTEDLAQNDVT